MSYIQEFYQNRQDDLRVCQHLRLLADQNLSLSGNKYVERPSQISRPFTSNVSHAHNQTFLFLSRTPSFEMKAPNWNHQQTKTKRANKDDIMTLPKSHIRDDYDKQITNENTSSRWHHQLSSSIYRPIKTPLKRSPSECDKIPFPTLIEPSRSSTAPLILEEHIRQAVSARIKATTPSRSSTLLRTSRLDDSTDTFDTLANSSFFHLEDELKQTECQSDNHFVCTNTTMNMNDTLNTSSYDGFLDESLPDEPNKILHRSSQCKLNGFQHIANLGLWQRDARNRRIELTKKSKEIEHEEELHNSLKPIYEYKSPFSEEYDQAISIQRQLQTNNNVNEWNLKDFYDDVKTDFEPETNTKPVFEKCLKLARLQSNTIKWEQRRRQNMNIYNRLIRNPIFDSNSLNMNGSFLSKNTNERDIRDINELKRELRCSECKRLACIGNCAPGQEYHQYKRKITFSSVPNTRDQIRSKLSSRAQRSSTDFRPRSTQQVIRETKFKFAQTNLNPVVVVPLFQDEPQTKRPQIKLTSEFLPRKSFRSSQKDSLGLVSTYNILS